MLHVISANRLYDGAVVYVGREAPWTCRLDNARVFTDKAELETGLQSAQSDAKNSLVVEPCSVEVTQEAGVLQAVSLRERIRAQGPTIDFSRRTSRAIPDATGSGESSHDPEEESGLQNLIKESSLA